MPPAVWEENMSERRAVRSRFFHHLENSVAALAVLLLLIGSYVHLRTASASEREPAGSKLFPGKLPITELTEDQAILHALNRLGFGPRPGDVERVRRMGLENWIEQQLHPESINDGDLNQRL